MQAALAPDPTRPVPTGNLRAVLARQGFRRLLGVRLMSQLSDGWFQAGLAGSIFFNPERAAGPLSIAAAFAVLLVPYSLLGPFVGVFLDRWSRRLVLFVANLTRAALVIPSAWLVWNGVENGAFVVTALAIVALNRFFLAGLSASQPHVAEEARLVTANSFATTAGSIVYSAGLASAALYFPIAGTSSHIYGAVAATALVGYLASAVLTLVSFGARTLGPDDAERSTVALRGALLDTARGMLAGLRHLGERPAATRIVIVQSVNRGLYGYLVIMTLLLYRGYFHVGDTSASVAGLLPVASAAAVGALIAAVMTPQVTRRYGGWRWALVLTGTLAVLVPALGLPYQQSLTVAAAGMVSLGTQGLKIVTDTALQVECHDDYRGRVFSVNDTVINILFVAGLFVGALLLPPNGHLPQGLLGVGLCYAALTIWYAVTTSRSPHLHLHHRH
jgi:Major Facilitator Superfamily